MIVKLGGRKRQVSLYVFVDKMNSDEVHFNYSRNLTEENAVLNTPELDTNSPSYKQNPTATVLQHLGKQTLYCKHFINTGVVVADTEFLIGRDANV